MSLSWEIRGAGMKTLAESSWRVEDQDSWEESSFCFLQGRLKLLLFTGWRKAHSSPMISMKRSTTPPLPSNNNKNVTNVGCIL